MKPISPTKVDFYQTKAQKVPFDKWISKLDKVVALKILGRIRNMSLGSMGDTKNVGDGVLEARIHFGPGYRIYFALKDDGQLVVILIGGDKSSQKADIEKAKLYWLDYKERT